MAKSKGTVLVVDDKGIVAKDIANKVKKLGYSVPATAHSSDDALAKAQEHRPDIILMDIKLKSKKDGIETADEILTKFGIPVIYLTAYSDESTLDRAKHTNPYGYIIKPYEEKELEVNLELAFARLKAERTIEEQYQRFKTIMDKYPEYIFVCDPETYEILFVNRKARDLMGKDPVGGKCYQEFNGAKVPCEKCSKSIIQKTRMPHVWEGYNKFMGRHLMNTDQIIEWPDGREVMFITSIDITDQKKIEKILLSSEMKYKSFIETSSYGFYILDPKGNVKYLNDKAYQIIGRDPNAGLNLHFSEIVSSRDIEQAKDALVNIAKHGVIEIPRTYSIQRPDGLTRIIEVQTIPFFENDEIAGFHGTVVDITERVTYEEEAKQKTEFLNAVINNTTDGIFVVDEDFNYVLINPASGRIMGHDPNEWVGKRAGTNRHPDDEKQSLEAVMKAMSGEPATCEVRVKHSSGEYRLLSMRYSLMMMGEKANLLGMVNDITERKKAEDALKASEDKYRSLFENSPESILIIGKNGKILECNNSTSVLTELKKGDLIGKNILELGLVDEAHIDSYSNLINSMYEGNELNPREAELLMPDGRSKWIEVFPSPISQNNEFYGIQLIARDITERKLADLEMRKKLLKYDLSEGNIYLTQEPVASQSIEAFKELLMIRYSGLLISREPVSEFRKKIEHGFNHIKVSEMDKENHVKPNYNAIHILLSGLPRGEVIHIDCIEYLISRIGANKTLNLIQYLKDLAITRNLIVLLSVDPSAIEQKYFRLIEKESKSITPSESLLKISSKLIETLEYIDSLNKESIFPSYSDIGVHFHLSKPTARARIRQLVELGTVHEIKKGRMKILELTEKGKNYLIV